MATPRTDSTGRIVQAAEKAQPAGQSLAAMLEKPDMQAQIAKALPKHVSPDRIVRIVVTALRTTKNLGICTPASFLGCVLQASQLGLEVNTPMGHAYLIPRRNGKASRDQGRDVYECTLITGYQGMIELSLRSGKVGGIWAHVVRDGDHFVWSLGLCPTLEHRPSDLPDREQRPITHAYAVARIKDADPVFEVLTAAQLKARSERSSSGNEGPWTTDTEAMCRKTAARALWKWIPKSAEMAQVDAIETAQDLGRSPVASLDDRVRGVLTTTGLDVPDSSADEPERDPETGEIIPDDVGRQPGQEG